MLGYINSIETMGLVDGPGIRFVVFMQGCKLRCLFCHNPETWKQNEGLVMTPEELMDKILRYKNYFDNNGGVTFSGGEPLLQGEFLVEILKLCKKNNIHTCLDTAGFGGLHNPDVLKYTDLVMMDIKALDNQKYKYLVGQDIKESLQFLELCKKMKKKLWIRQVIIPDFNDTEEYVLKLKEFLSNYEIEKVEFLPYETLGVPKYEKLKITYRLVDLKPMDKEKCNKLLEYYESLEIKV